RFLLHPFRDPDHRDDRQAAGEAEVEDGLVDAEVETADVERDPRFEFELVLRLEGFVLAVVAEDQEQEDENGEESAESDPELGFGAEAPGLRRLGSAAGARVGDGRAHATLPLARRPAPSLKR